MKVFVYRNLRDRCYSLRSGGKVIGHCRVVRLKNAKFKVNQKARQRILAGGRKTVHAGVEGELFEDEIEFNVRTYRVPCVNLAYNPRIAGHFYLIGSNGEVTLPFEVADYVELAFLNDRPMITAYYKV